MPLSLRNDPAVCTPLQHVHVTSSFWTGRITAVREGALGAIYQQLKDTGRWDSLKLQWKEGDPKKPYVDVLGFLRDSDVAKWLEAACYSLITHPDPALAHLVEEAVDLIRGAQQEDGYLNSYYTVVEPGRRWTNIAWSHEMYCAGHLLEAALAHHEYTHSTRLLDPLLKYIDHIRTVFGPEAHQKHGYPGHQCLELALVRAYDATQDRSILSLARYFIEERGQKRPYEKESGTLERHYYDVEADARSEQAFVGPMRRRGDRFEYMQADKPVRDMAKEGIRGHSVRAMYWLSAVAGVARLTEDGDGSLKGAVRKLWENTTEKRMYITGGLGAIGEWEGFGPDYFFPNETGYLETCAAVGLVFFAHQMLLLDSFKPMYAEVMERALYNGVLVGMSLDGKGFFYDNPLATVEKDMQRSEWFEVACCPPNVSRLLVSLGKYIYTFTSSNTIYVHLYISSVVEITVAYGRLVKITQNSDLLKGGSTFTLTGDARDLKRIKLGLRRPAGVHAWEVEVNGIKCLSLETPTMLLDLSAYMPTAWTTTLSVSMVYTYVPRIIRPHPLDSENHGCIAIAKGPFVYCLETVDNPEIPDLRAVRVRPEDGIKEHMETEKFKDWGLEVITLRIKGTVVEEQACEREVDLTLVPYFVWANRGRSDLRLWLRALSG
ncbi:glycoside hydrolase family 127 protein [Neolentinus lepideus HHB14362 ss-1]|uniref:Glycoside hydrolase family 127 protein n=1 Tax=Neolentinus lepideus HHB14362 ss-1 TaxID=1314782 RepID=A0A165S959_9AGAM|nr:glycoside hydrolase family 127 protein [Neolentinus lepideus HHB14362 ss-1]